MTALLGLLSIALATGWLLEWDYRRRIERMLNESIRQTDKALELLVERRQLD